MYKLKCVDLGSPSCPFVATGDDREEVINKMKDHARIIHAANLDGKSDTQLTKEFDEAVTEE